MNNAAEVPKTAVIIEDDADIRHILAEVLEAAGFSTVSVGNGLDGVRAVLTYQPLITTLDVNLPGIDGFEATRRIRAQSDTYIILLTGQSDETDVILGLSAGADEYIVKPFRPRELRARIEAMLRRPRNTGTATPPSAAPGRESVGPSFPAGRPATTAIPVVPAAADAAASDDVVVLAEASGTALATTGSDSTVIAVADDGTWLEHRDLRLDPDSRIVILGNTELELTRTEFDLLAALLESKRRVRSKADLTLLLRGESYVTSYFVGDADKRAIEAHMTNLRRKLNDNPSNPRYIETVRGVGYRLTSDRIA
ncbi:MAG: response regulator transcription factor [Microbacterium pygmaeum]